jgi:hypothetical protein
MLRPKAPATGSFLPSREPRFPNARLFPNCYHPASPEALFCYVFAGLCSRPRAHTTSGQPRSLPATERGGGKGVVRSNILQGPGTSLFGISERNRFLLGLVYWAEIYFFAAFNLNFQSPYYSRFSCSAPSTFQLGRRTTTHPSCYV